MRIGALGIVFSIALLAISAAAELQNVEVGGKIEIYGAAYSKFYDAALLDRIPAAFLRGRPMGPNGTVSLYRTDGKGDSFGFFEQRTRLHVKADFTDEVSAFVELDSIDTWGEDFRSVNYVTGADTRSNSGDDVELFQAYIDVAQIWGLPVSLRVGRQELEFGSGWLVGADPGPDYFTGLSFDAIRLTYEQDEFTVDAWAAKVAETFSDFGDGDIDFYGVYATYALPGGESDEDSPLQLDLYWMLLRDDQPVSNTSLGVVGEWWEDVLDRDQYGTTMLHTAGARLSGAWASFDYEAEAAYQWGNADALGALFAPVGGLYGDSDARWSNWAGHMEAGYTLDVKYSPRLYIGGSYYGGEDRRDLSFSDWLNPFNEPEASASFNRLFSSWREDMFFDMSGMSNFWKAYLGATAAFPSDAVELGFSLTYLSALDSFDQPVGMVVDGRRVPFFSMFPFWTDSGSNDLGWQTFVYATYQYSEDLSFEVGWSHYFVGDAMADGVFADDNGLSLLDGLGADDVDYLYFYTVLEF